MAQNGVKFYHSIGFRFSVLITTVIFFSVVALSFFSAMTSFERETENYKSLMRGAATAYAASVSDAVYEGNRIATLSSLRGIRDLPNVVQVDVVDPDGRVLAELGTGSWLVTDEANEISLWRSDSVRVDTPIMKGGVEIARLGMLVDLKPLRREIVHNLFVSLISAGIVIVIGAILAQFFVSRLMAPVRRLTRVMAGVRDSGADAPLELRNRKDETGLMTQTFVDMMGSIRERDAQIAEHMETLEATVEERTHDLRIAKEDAEAANAAKSDFLATMSHEIRTPMNGMMVMAEMLGAADLSPRHRRYAEIIHRSGNSLLTIINDILDLSKIEAGQLDLECIPVSPERLVMDVTSLFWERARSKQLELAAYVSPRVPDEILADPTRLNQIISNLVNNALKFTEQGGVLIRLDAVPDGETGAGMIIEVIDTGIGIPADKIDTIFESFSQADQSTTRRFGGTGLGLTVCQRLVSAMNGEITVISAVGKGSTFRVTFPTEIKTASGPVSKSACEVGLLHEEGLTRIAIEKTLADAGCRIVDTSPDFWISNSSAFETKSEPVILLSDIGDTSIDRLLESGKAADCLPLPYGRADISELIVRAQSKSFRGAEAMLNRDDVQDHADFAGLRVLAADDNAVNREVLREALSTLRISASFAENGEEALERFKSSEFDLVFMDGSMPIMDGFEATRLIRAFEVEQGRTATPIYALTAQVAGQSEEAWDVAGANGHLFKPFTLNKLADVLNGLEANACVAAATTETSVERTPFLDLTTVESLEKLGAQDGSVRDKVWNMFAEKAPTMLTQLLELMKTDDLPAVAKQAHAFKSMALSSGLSALARQLQELETQSANGADDVDFARYSRDLDTLVSESQVAMEDYKRRVA
jgi:two-component system sensor histidine kinase BarA